MSIGWQQIWGFGLAVIGVYYIVKRDVPVGIEGQPPSFHAKGWLAVALGVIGIVVGLVVAFDVPRHLRIDSCLDNGGRFDAETDECIFSTVPVGKQ